MKYIDIGIKRCLAINGCILCMEWRGRIRGSKMKEKILVVGEELVRKEGFSDRLSDAFDVVVVKDSKEAIVMMDEQRHFDAILLSMVVPQIDGYRVLHYLKGQHRPKDSRVVAITGEETYQVHINEFAGLVDETVKEPQTVQEMLYLMQKLTVAC